MIVLPKHDSLSVNLSHGGSSSPEDPSLTILDLKDYVNTNLKSLQIQDLQSELPQNDPQENTVENENLRQGLFGQKKVQFNFD